MEESGICSAAFCESAALRGSWTPSQALTRQLSQRESLWRNRRLCNLLGNFPDMPRAPPLGELPSEARLRGRGRLRGTNPLRLCFANPPPPKGGGFALLTGSCRKAPPSGELDATNGSGLRGLAVPLDRLSPAGERCRASDRVGNGWLRPTGADGRGQPSPSGELASSAAR